MKTIFSLFSIYFSLILNAQNLNGSWVNNDNKQTTLLLIQDNYLTKTTFTPTEFLNTNGGTIKIKDGKITLKEEFNTTEKELKTLNPGFELKGDVLTFENLNFKKAETQKSELAGVWKISGRVQDGELVEIQHSGTRKTLKLLTNTHFQWFAIDPAENKFFGTGGGTYSFKDGKYTENIEFFSRDNSRVGASLEFNDRIEDGNWVHTGLSSRGEPIHEIWKKIE